jgi:hypothetical protein
MWYDLSRPAVSMIEDAEKKGLITPGKVSHLMISDKFTAALNFTWK